MPTITEKTVREIAIENPASVRVFESVGIDYCCGGKRSFTDACAHAGVDPLYLATLLDETSQDPSIEDVACWNEKPLADLMAYIVARHHAFVRAEIPRIGSLLGKVVDKHGEAHPEVAHIEQIFVAIGQELGTHMFKEEQILFPYIQRLEEAAESGAPLPSACFASVERPIANMVAEHDDAGALLADMRRLSRGYTPPPEACPTFRALYLGLEEFERDLHRHVHLENNILFPRAIEMEKAAGR